MRLNSVLTDEHVERHHDVEDDAALLPLLLVEDGAGELRDGGLDAVLGRDIARRDNLHPRHFLKQDDLWVTLSSTMTPSTSLGI